jgi:hypothetical protein
LSLELDSTDVPRGPRERLSLFFSSHQSVIFFKSPKLAQAKAKIYGQHSLTDDDEL